MEEDDLKNMSAKKQSSWGSEDITFNGGHPKIKKEEAPVIDDKQIKYAPELKDTHETLFASNFLKVKKNNGYFYAERKGVDSVAFILIATNAADERRIGIINEYKDPIERFVSTAFGGSIDDEKFHQDLRTLVKEEALEEAGFDVTLDVIKYHGKVMVSTQSNQFCHLFSIEVNKLEQGDKTTTNPRELRDKLNWITMAEVPALEDWKAQAIILRRMMANQGLVFVSTASQKQ